MYRETTAVCSEIHAKHIQMHCGQNTEFMYVKAGGTVHKVSLRLRKVKISSSETKGHQPRQETPRLLRASQVHCPVHKNYR